MQETMRLGDSRVLLGDFRGAQWVARNDPDMPTEVLRKRFCRIHEFFLRNVRRPRPGLFSKVPPELFVDVVRKWIVLYRETLAALRGRFSREPGSLDLELDGANWSAELEIAYEGLLEIGYFSRYAEIWAEKSLKSEGWYRTYDDRRAFVGSAAFWHVFELAKAGELDVVDALGNGLTAFDLIGVARSPLHEGDLARALRRVGWTVRTLSDASTDAIDWYARHGSTNRCPHDGPHAAA